MTTPEVGEPAISVGQLRQNPTEMIRHVRGGEEYVLTDRGTPVARIVPYLTQEWIGAAEARAAFKTPVGADWAKELDDARSESDMTDPFER